MAVDEDKVMEFLGRVVTDGGAAVAGLCTSLGDRLGLYTAMAGAGPMTAAQLAARTGLHERYLREWLAAQVAGEYVATTGTPTATCCPTSTRPCWPIRPRPPTRPGSSR